MIKAFKCKGGKCNNGKHIFTHIVAYDGSKLGEKALKVAIDFLKQSPDVELDIATVYEFPKGLESFGLYNEGLLKEFRYSTEQMMEKVNQQTERRKFAK